MKCRARSRNRSAPRGRPSTPVISGSRGSGSRCGSPTWTSVRTIVAGSQGCSRPRYRGRRRPVDGRQQLGVGAARPSRPVDRPAAAPTRRSRTPRRTAPDHRASRRPSGYRRPSATVTIGRPPPSGAPTIDLRLRSPSSDVEGHRGRAARRSPAAVGLQHRPRIRRRTGHTAARHRPTRQASRPRAVRRWPRLGSALAPARPGSRRAGRVAARRRAAPRADHQLVGDVDGRPDRTLPGIRTAVVGSSNRAL